MPLKISTIVPYYGFHICALEQFYICAPNVPPFHFHSCDPYCFHICALDNFHRCHPFYHFHIRAPPPPPPPPHSFHMCSPNNFHILAPILLISEPQQIPHLCPKIFIPVPPPPPISAPPPPICNCFLRA